MRLTSCTVAMSLTLASCCSGCASLGHHRQSACDRASAMQIADRVADPCGYADAIGTCAGLPERERMRVIARCAEELDQVGGNATVGQ